MAGDTVAVGHDSAGRLRVTRNGASLLGYVTSDSDDDLLLGCGRAQALHLLSDARASCRVSVRGRWL